MKLAALATLASSAAAFAPARTGPASTSLRAFEQELGVQPPVGFFDPLGLLDGADQAKFDRLRYVEIKHGRISMLAFLGNLWTRAGFHLVGPMNYAGDTFDQYPNGLAAMVGPDAISKLAVAQIFFFCGALELWVMKDYGEGEFVGDFRNGFIDFGWDTFTDEQKAFKRGVELNNGRAAMFDFDVTE